MKSFKGFIIEKFKINSKTKINITNLICNYWGLDPDEEIKEAIDKWVKENDVKSIFPITIKNTLKLISNFVKDDFLKDYKTVEYPFQISQNYNVSLLKNLKYLYKHNSRGEKFDITGNEYMISIISWYGELYCIIDN